MQIDTPISPGNSGGGCFDTRGRFIGMPEVYLPPAQTGAENIGFCIPADAVASVAKIAYRQVVAGRVEPAFMPIWHRVDALRDAIPDWCV